MQGGRAASEAVLKEAVDSVRKLNFCNITVGERGQIAIRQGQQTYSRFTKTKVGIISSVLRPWLSAVSQYLDFEQLPAREWYEPLGHASTVTQLSNAPRALFHTVMSSSSLINLGDPAPIIYGSLGSEVSVQRI